MKRIYFTTIALLVSASTHAQWVNYNNTGNYYLYGSIGIGTAPISNVKLAIDAGGGTLLFTGLGNQAGQLSIDGFGNAGGTGILFPNSVSYVSNYGVSNEILAYNASSNHRLLINNSEKTSLISDNLGIGTTYAGAKVDIEGGKLRLGDGQGNFTGFYFNTTTGLTQENNTLITLNGAIRVNSKANLDSYIIGNGNVGINTTDTKGYKLAVNGSAVANAVTIKMYPWADYVFNKDYAMMPIVELKEFIEENQHLPEMPSEKEIAENGLSLGGINKLLTKKVEELTLYLIEKDKQIDEFKQRQKIQYEVNQKLKEQLATIETQLSKLTD